MLGNVSFAVFVYPLAKKLGLRNVVIFACSIITLGSFMRSLINHSFAFVLFGQLVIGMGTCLIVHLKMQFCYNWFHPVKRPIFISLSSILNIFGGGIGNLIPLLFVRVSQTNIIEIKASIEHYTMVIFWIVFAMFIIVLLAFKENPPAGFGSHNQVYQRIDSRSARRGRRQLHSPKLLLCKVRVEHSDLSRLPLHLYPVLLEPRSPGLIHQQNGDLAWPQNSDLMSLWGASLHFA